MPLRYACLALGLLMLGSHALAESGAPPTGTEAPPKQAALPERAPLAERSQVDARALERQLAQQEQQQLNAGEETFLALWLPANVAEANGAVILLPGDAESVDWPLSVGPL
ncbi:DUF3530 family protein, partial [Pseudomonas sp. CrR25]|nr:DUF3530 family protein [Pseudomonas sp. CrR25]